MSRLLGVVFIYAAMMLAWTGVGLFMLIAPARFENLVHENLQLFAEVNPGKTGARRSSCAFWASACSPSRSA
jgi:hypothetical protein